VAAAGCDIDTGGRVAGAAGAAVSAAEEKAGVHCRRYCHCPTWRAKPLVVGAADRGAGDMGVIVGMGLWSN